MIHESTDNLVKNHLHDEEHRAAHDVIEKTGAPLYQSADSSGFDGETFDVWDVPAYDIRLRAESAFESDVRAHELGNLQGIDHRYGYRFIKRLFDIVFSFIVCAFMVIPAAILCIVICAESPGNPIYKQIRVKKNGKEFTMYKFRSMVKDADVQLVKLQDLNEASGPLFKIREDPRMTKVGICIRKHSIDEFPQFLNVLKGDMSVVGPRPPLPREVVQYDDYTRQRLLLKPGITGYWQTRGRNNLAFRESIEYDLEYVRDCNWREDVQIVLKTIPCVFNGKGAS